MTTLKQRIAFKEIVENGRSASAAMREAGYSAKTATAPAKLTTSDGFKELMEQMGISDEKLAKRLDEGLDATKAVVMGKESNESFVDIQPDYMVRHKYIETSFKLKRYLDNDKKDFNFNVNFINNVPRPTSTKHITESEAS